MGAGDKIDVGVHGSISRASERWRSNAARASVAIDVFMMLGNSAEVSAQLVARQLINGRVRLPDEGDDVRGWKRLLVWRDRLASLKEPLEHYQLYANILREVERLPKSKIRELAVDGRLWNMRAWSNT